MPVTTSPAHHVSGALEVPTCGWIFRGRISRHIFISNKGKKISSLGACKSVGNQQANVEGVSSALLTWANENGVTAPKVAQGMINGRRGLIALDSISEDEIFVGVPRSLALVVDPLERCPCKEFISQGVYQKFPWDAKMATLLLCEKRKGRNSRLYTYISQLPKIDTPVRWSESELDELQSPLMKDIVLKQKQEWRQYYDEFRKACTGKDEEKESWDEFLWAMENVRSRTFSGPYAGSSLKERLSMAAFLGVGGLLYASIAHIPLQSIGNAAIAAASFNLMYDLILSSRLKWYGMCPVIDGINHCGSITSDIQYEYFSNKFALTTNRSYKPGDELFISYKKANSLFVQYYGFVEEENPDDVYKIDVDIAGCHRTLSLQYDGQVAQSSLDELSKDDELKDNFEKLDNAESKLSSVVRKSLISALEKEISSKATTLADDKRLLKNPGMIKDERMELAIKFRVSQKKILERALKAACSNANNQP